MAKPCPHCGGESACAIIPGLPFDRCPSYWFEMREIERRAYLTRLAKARSASADQGEAEGAGDSGPDAAGGYVYVAGRGHVYVPQGAR